MTIRSDDEAPGPGVATRRARRAPSIGDVAKAAGVSAQTVSRVSNGLSNVEERTRDRVLAAMRELDYRPNSAARALRRGSFNTIGVIMFGFSSVGNLRTLEAVSIAAANADYLINVIPVPHPTPREVELVFSQLSDHPVDGLIIIIESHVLRAADFEMPVGVPIVIMDSMKGDRPIVDNDQTLGARQATTHLLSLGHRTVWHIAGPAASVSSIRREESWRTVLTEAGATVPEVLYGDWTADSGYRHGVQLAARDDVTAIFVANDQMALGVMRAMHENGRRVPEDVSVVGFDDVEEAANYWPPLTTVRQDFIEIGRRGVATLINSIRRERVPVDTDPVATTLIIRASTAPPPEAN